MSRRRRCAETKADGSSCGAPPLRDEVYCRLHHPDHADAVALARQIGGRNRRREATLATSYDLPHVGDLDGLRRLHEIGVHETLAMESSADRARLIARFIEVGLKLHQAGEQEERIRELEAIVGRTRGRPRRKGTS